MASYEFLDHMADIKVKVKGKTEQELFEQSTLAVAEYLSSNKKIALKKEKTIKVSGQDIKSLLYNYLDELLYFVDAEHFVVGKSKIKIKDNELHAQLVGDSTKNYELQAIKSATYAEMDIKKNNKGWEAVFVLDV